MEFLALAAAEGRPAGIHGRMWRLVEVTTTVQQKDIISVIILTYSQAPAKIP